MQWVNQNIFNNVYNLKATSEALRNSQWFMGNKGSKASMWSARGHFLTQMNNLYELYIQTNLSIQTFFGCIPTGWVCVFDRQAKGQWSGSLDWLSGWFEQQWVIIKWFLMHVILYFKQIAFKVFLIYRLTRGYYGPLTKRASGISTCTSEKSSEDMFSAIWYVPTFHFLCGNIFFWEAKEQVLL